MAVTTVNAVVADVMFMTELNGLLLFEKLSGQIRRPGHLCVDIKRYSGQYNNHHHADAGNVVCTSIKKLPPSLLSLAERVVKVPLLPNLVRSGWVPMRLSYLVENKTAVKLAKILLNIIISANQTINLI